MKCYACDGYRPVNDIGLCGKCNALVERDMIRDREWDYSVTAYGLRAHHWERLRRSVMIDYGIKRETYTKEAGKAYVRAPHIRINARRAKRYLYRILTSECE